MNHLIVAPLLIPLLTGAVIVLAVNRPHFFHRAVSLAGCLVLVLITGILMFQSISGPIQVYALGDWVPPFGIVMVVDRLSALMVFMTALLGLLCLLYAILDTDTRGKNFHALYQFQLMGINGAFLTGDIFNLFVFFEIMLLASYGLVLHGGGGSRTRAGMHYALLNLIGSSIFLIGVGILYSLLGTLNMADLAVQISMVPPENAALIRAAGLILFGVFALKAALVPLYFWLPDTYGFTGAPVAALFAIMTKVGVYVILRVYTLMFGPHAGAAANLLTPWLLPAALITLAAGVAGVAASRNLRHITAYFVVVSVGTLLAVISTFQTQALAAAIVYLPHTTFMTAVLFLVTDMIARQRPNAGAQLIPDHPVAQQTLLGLLFTGAAIAIAGLPPLSGFFAKVMMLLSVHTLLGGVWIWIFVLAGGALGLIALGRAGIIVFWKTLPMDDTRQKSRPEFCKGYGQALPALALISISPLLVLFGHPMAQFADTVASQLMEPFEYIAAVLGSDRAAQLFGSTGGL
jgi:multicomponent K+:H+ antiporter subunit D